MKKTLLKVKDTITFEDKVNAVTLILNAFWDDETNNYTPWMEEPAKIIAVGKYFVEGYELEEGENLYNIYLSDDDMKNIIDTFVNPDYEARSESVKKYIKIMDFVNRMVYDKLEWTKQNIIHAHPDMDRIVEGVNVFIDAFKNFSNLDLLVFSINNILRRFINIKSRSIFHNFSDIFCIKLKSRFFHFFHKRYSVFNHFWCKSSKIKIGKILKCRKYR